MRLSENGRNSLLENTVFGLALFLVAVLIFYGARSLLARRPQVPLPAGGGMTVSAMPGQTPLEGASAGTAVTSIPPVKISHMEMQRRWRVEVPPPAGKTKN